MGLEHGVHLWSLAANASHFLQPLDDLCFGNFKKHTYRNHSMAVFNRAAHGEELSHLLLDAAYDAEISAFTPAVISAAFKNTGLAPFDPAIIRKNLMLNTGKFEADSRVAGCRAAASSVLEESRSAGKKNRSKETITGTAVVLKNNVYSPQALLREAEARRRELAAIEKSKQDEKTKKTCRAESCDSVHRDGSGWLVCPCGTTRFCKSHKTGPHVYSCPCTSLQPSSKRQRNESSDSAQPSRGNVSPAFEPQPASFTPVQQCPMCSLLLTDDEEHQHCNHEASSAIQTDSSSPSASPQDPLPASNQQHTQGTCSVCSLSSRHLLNGRCTKRECQEFDATSKRVRKAPRRQ